MRSTHCSTQHGAIDRQFEEIRLSERERHHAAHEMRRAEAVADALIRAAERIASIGARLRTQAYKKPVPGETGMSA